REGGQASIACNLPNLTVSIGTGVAMALDLPEIQVDDPQLRYAGGGIEGRLDRAIVGDRRFGHLDEQKDVAWAWVTLRVVVTPESQQPKIGLRLGQVTCPDGVLDLNGGPGRQSASRAAR